MKHQRIFTSIPHFVSRPRFSAGMFGLLGIAVLLFGATNANAACGMFNPTGSHNSIKLPALTPAELGSAPPWRANPSIVGLWHVIYTTGSGSDSSTFNNTFDTWHADGTEFETAYLAPVGGDVCVGVWKQTDPRTFVLHHVGWLFSPFDSNGNATNLSGTATNYFTLDEIITVTPEGESYSGTFTFKIWTLDGTFTGVQVPGTIAAVRIIAN